jgi:hypothetical protein
LANTLSKVAVVYGVLWVLSFWFQNIIYSTIISGFGVALLVFVAISTESLLGEIDNNNLAMKTEIENLRKEVAELKNSGKKQVKP